MRIHHCILLPVVAGLIACSNGTSTNNKAPAAWVKTVPLAVNQHNSSQGFSGTIRARKEVPIAFQLGGRISERLVDAGQTVVAGTTLFKLDARDIEQNLHAAEAALNAAQAELAVSRAELERSQKLIAQNTISQQMFDNIKLQERVSTTRMQVAETQVKQARLGMDNTVLQSETQGVLMDVTGEPGQVINPGQTIAVLADTNELEVEIFLPDGFVPPRQAELQAADGKTLAITLREVAGAADPASRTWRVRYSLEDKQAKLALGSIVKVTMAGSGTNTNVYNVPLGALDERGHGPRLWQIVNGKAEPVAIKVLSLDKENARIETTLPPESHIIALGTQLLEPGMAVRDKAEATNVSVEKAQ